MSLKIHNRFVFSRIISACLFVCALASLSGPVALSFEIKLEKDPEVTSTQKKPTEQYSAKAPAILDTREAFEYRMSHFQDAMPVRWSQYAQEVEGCRGIIDSDSSLAARRLRVLGVHPDREVVVLGSVMKDEGGSGWIAWLLKALGVKKVKLVPIESWEGKKAFGESKLVVSAPFWSPTEGEKDHLRVTLPELAQIVKEKKPGFQIIDIRTDKEREGATPRLRHQIPDSLAAPWTEFLNSKGFVLSGDNIKSVLRRHGVDETKKLIFYGNDGLRSALVTYIVAEAGVRALNFDASLCSWTLDKNLPLK